MGSFEKKYTKDWDFETKRKAMLLLNSVTSFEFIISLIGLYKLLHPLAGITNHLQGHEVDIIEAYDEVSSLIKDIKSIWQNTDTEFGVIFEQAVLVAGKVEIEPIPHSANKQVNRETTGGDSPQTYYRRVFAILFFDQLISELELRLTK